MSVYASRAFGLLGLCVAFCTFPSLVAGSLYKSSTNNTYILYSSVLRMYLALVAGVLGSFSCSALTYRKIFAHDVIFSAITVKLIWYNRAASFTVVPVICTKIPLFHSHQAFWWLSCPHGGTPKLSEDLTKPASIHPLPTWIDLSSLVYFAASYPLSSMPSTKAAMAATPSIDHQIEATLGKEACN